MDGHITSHILDHKNCTPTLFNIYHYLFGLVFIISRIKINVKRFLASWDMDARALTARKLLVSILETLW